MLSFRLEAVPEMNYSPTADVPAGEVCVKGPSVFKGCGVGAVCGVLCAVVCRVAVMLRLPCGMACHGVRGEGPLS